MSLIVSTSVTYFSSYYATSPPREDIYQHNTALLMIYFTATVPVLCSPIANVAEGEAEALSQYHHGFI